MKHPTLVRVFSVVLSIMCLAMLLAGAFMIDKTKKDNSDNTRRYNLLAERTEKYKELLEKTADSVGYEKASAELEEKQEKHDEDASQHKTDVATYSATKGGLNEAMDQLDEAGWQIRNLYINYNAGLAKFNEQAGPALAGISAATGLSLTTDNFVSVLSSAYSNASTVINNVASMQALYAQLSDIQTQLASLNPEEEGYEEKAAELGAQAAAIQEQLAGMPTYSEEEITKAYTVKATYEDGGVQALIAGKQALDSAKAQLDAAMYQVEDNVFYVDKMLGDLDDDAAELTEEKERLDAETEELDNMTSEVEEMNYDEQKLTSLKVLLMKNANISKAVDEGESLESAADKEVERYGSSIKKEYLLRILTSAAMILGAVLGISGIPAAFEKTKFRALLIAPVVLALLFAVASEIISLSLGRDLLYSSLAVVAFAAIQLAFVLPKVKQIHEMEEQIPAQ